jgi:hypothetical protein
MTVTAAGGGSGGTAVAGITYSFVSDQDAYIVAPGGTVNVQVFLQETVDGTDTSLLVSENGLSSAQVTLQRISPEPIEPALITAYTPDFDPPTHAVIENVFTSSELDVSQIADIGAPSGPMGLDLGGGVRRVPLLTAAVQAGTIRTEVTTFRLSDFPPIPETVTWNNMLPLDDLISPFEFTVTAIPEPSTIFMVLTLAGVSLGLSVLRRRTRVDVISAKDAS